MLAAWRHPGSGPDGTSTYNTDISSPLQTLHTPKGKKQIALKSTRLLLGTSSVEGFKAGSPPKGTLVVGTEQETRLVQ